MLKATAQAAAKALEPIASDGQLNLRHHGFILAAARNSLSSRARNSFGALK